MEDSYNRILIFHECQDKRIKILNDTIYPNVGSVFYIVKGVVLEIEEGIDYTIIYLNTNFRKSFLTFIGEFIKFNEIFKDKIKCNNIEEWTEMPVRSYLCVQLTYGEMKVLDMSLEKLVESESTYDNVYSLLLFIECYTILYNFFAKRIIEKTKERPINKEAEIVLKVERYIEKNLDKKIRLEDIAKNFGESTKSINILFKRVKKETVNKYIISKRIEVARRMLLEENIDIEAISKKVGIQDITYFYRIFKKETGTTPRKYRLENSFDSLGG